ncbi:universal stress protein [Pseudovibrio exalbescens]|uniref:universal stress protein n=1 Tax=Pseudovibrio exalbescens TaxID=197461 RepID=UPI000C9D247E|nr:universal stress protein [Pseudovibrio exalbescens]
MRHFHNLLYVSHGTADDTEGLKQALSLARNNAAPLKVMVVGPEFPREFPNYQKNYETLLLEQVEQSIDATKAALELPHDAVDIRLTLVADRTPAIKVIQEVLQHGHDLVIKEAEPRDKRGGFKAIDMELLRKCPVPVWLCKPITHSRQHIKVAVAIDPETQEPVTEQLAKRMLELSRSLADSCSGDLHIISCWDYEFEGYLRKNVWVKTPDTKIEETVLKAKTNHRSALLNLINTSGIHGPHRVHHLRGDPSDQIPRFVRDHKVNILVMGTVARTGIPGFMFGNTAENIVQQLSCSLMALKPQGFVSPVKAF